MIVASTQRQLSVPTPTLTLHPVPLLTPIHDDGSVDTDASVSDTSSPAPPPTTSSSAEQDGHNVRNSGAGRARRRRESLDKRVSTGIRTTGDGIPTASVRHRRARKALHELCVITNVRRAVFVTTQSTQVQQSLSDEYSTQGYCIQQTVSQRRLNHRCHLF